VVATVPSGVEPFAALLKLNAASDLKLPSDIRTRIEDYVQASLAFETRVELVKQFPDLGGEIRHGRASLPRKFTFGDPEKIRGLARRGEAMGTSENRQMLEHSIDTGRGGVYLKLTPEQYASSRPVTAA
jgi:aromatic ring hydroxylase